MCGKGEGSPRRRTYAMAVALMRHQEVTRRIIIPPTETLTSWSSRMTCEDRRSKQWNEGQRRLVCKHNGTRWRENR